MTLLLVRAHKKKIHTTKQTVTPTHTPWVFNNGWHCSWSERKENRPKTKQWSTSGSDHDLELNTLPASLDPMSMRAWTRGFKIHVATTFYHENKYNWPYMTACTGQRLFQLTDIPKTGKKGNFLRLSETNQKEHRNSHSKSDGACAHYVMVSKFQWKWLWLVTQLLDPQNDWTGWQIRVNYDVFAQAPLKSSG